MWLSKFQHSSHCQSSQRNVLLRGKKSVTGSSQKMLFDLKKKHRQVKKNPTKNNTKIKKTLLFLLIWTDLEYYVQVINLCNYENM